MQQIISWLESHLMPCFTKSLLGIDCPGCGLQRSIIELLRGNVLDSIATYPPLIPLIMTFLLLLVHLLKPFKTSLFILKISYIFTASTIVISYILKFI